MVYNTGIQQNQDDAAGNILTDSMLEATIVDSPEYERRCTSAWFAKLNAAPAPRATYHAIIEEWRTGCYDADIAIGWLYAYRLLTEPYRGDAYKAYKLMAMAARKEFGPVALPEPPEEPVSYANSDLLAALAPARAGGGGA